MLTSIEFAGFSDGYNGNANRYQGAHGTPQQVTKTPDFLTSIIRQAEALSNANEKDLQDLVELYQSRTPKVTYTKQNTLGWSCAGK